MFRTPSFRDPSSLCFALALVAPVGCTNNDKPEEAAAGAEAKEGEAKEGAKELVGEKGAEAVDAIKAGTPSGLAKAVAEGVAAAETGGRLDRGDALGHFVVPNASAVIEKARTKVAPAKQSAFLNEEMLRGLAGMQLGARAGVSKHLSLSQPMGCAWIDDTAAEMPVACIVGYEGGAQAVLTDLGSEGQQADAGGHAGHYRIDGNDIYLDELAGQVVVTNHTAIFAKAKGYLQSNLVDRADSMTDDFELVVFPSAAMKRYSEQIETLMSTLSGAEPAATGNPIVDSFAAYSKSSTERGFDYYREIDQFDWGMGIQDVGFVFRYGMYPSVGTSTQTDLQAMFAGPLNTAFVSGMPEQSWMVVGYSVDWKAAWSTQYAEVMRNMLVDTYATAVGRDGDTVRASIESHMNGNDAIYGNDVAFSVMHLPGTNGGLVMSRAIKAPGRDSWKTWAEGFAADAILGPEGSKYVTWSFAPDVLEVDGVAVDRWTIEPGPESKKELKAKADPTMAEIERRMGGLAIHLDRIELGDRSVVVIAPGAQEQYLKAVIAAAKGGPGVGSDAGFKTVLARSPKSSMVMAVDAAGALAWARDVLPPEATKKIPPGIGVDLSDFFFTMESSESGVQRGEMVMSQAFIDQLRALAD